MSKRHGESMSRICLVGNVDFEIVLITLSSYQKIKVHLMGAPPNLIAFGAQLKNSTLRIIKIKNISHLRLFSMVAFGFISIRLKSLKRAQTMSRNLSRRLSNIIDHKKQTPQLKNSSGDEYEVFSALNDRA